MLENTTRGRSGAFVNPTYLPDAKRDGADGLTIFSGSVVAERIVYRADNAGALINYEMEVAGGWYTFMGGD